MPLHDIFHMHGWLVEESKHNNFFTSKFNPPSPPPPEKRKKMCFLLLSLHATHSLQGCSKYIIPTWGPMVIWKVVVKVWPGTGPLAHRSLAQ